MADRRGLCRRPRAFPLTLLLLPALVGLSLLATAGWFLASYRADAEDRRDAARPAATTTTIAPTSTTLPGPEAGVFDPAPGTSPGAGRGTIADRIRRIAGARPPCALAQPGRPGEAR